MEGEEVFITGHDEIRPAVDREFEEHVVAGIAAGADEVNDGNHFGDAAEQAQELLPLRDADVRVKLAARENAGEFAQGRLGNQQLSGLDGSAHGLPGNRGRKQEPADERVVVNDDAF